MGFSLKKLAKKVTKRVKKAAKKVGKAAKKAGKGIEKTAKIVGKGAKKGLKLAGDVTDFEKVAGAVAGGICSGPLKGKTCNKIVKSTVRVGGSLADFATGGQITAAHESLTAAQKMISGDFKGLLKQGTDFLKDEALSTLTAGASEHLETLQDATGQDISGLVKNAKSGIDAFNKVSGYVDDPMSELIKQSFSAADNIAKNTGYSPANVVRQLRDTLPLHQSQNMTMNELLNTNQGKFLTAMSNQMGNIMTPGALDVNEGQRYLSDLGDVQIANQLEQLQRFNPFGGESAQSISRAYQQYSIPLQAPLNGPFQGQGVPFGGYRGFHPQRSYGYLPTQFSSPQQFPQQFPEFN